MKSSASFLLAYKLKETNNKINSKINEFNIYFQKYIYFSVNTLFIYLFTYNQVNEESFSEPDVKSGWTSCENMVLVNFVICKGDCYLAIRYGLHHGATFFYPITFLIILSSHLTFMSCTVFFSC